MAISGTGVLKQWQLHNLGNHLGFVPGAFFGLRASCAEPPVAVARILEGPPLPAATPTPNVNDDLDGPPGNAREFRWPRVQDTRFTAAYPNAEIDYIDQALPVTVSLTASTPLVPLDSDASSLPLASFRFRITNTVDSPHGVAGWLAMSMQNLVGWDGIAPITGSRGRGLGGNINTEVSMHGGTAIAMTSQTVLESSRSAGSMAIWSDRPAAPILDCETNDEVLALVEAFRTATSADGDLSDLRHRLGQPSAESVPSPAGATWTGALCVPFHLGHAESTEIEFVLAWTFPNRDNAFDQPGGLPRPPITIVGNHYATRFDDAVSVIAAYEPQRAELRRETSKWVAAVFDSDLPREVADVLAAQPSLLRSPTTFRTADGRFYGFEGVLGESTRNWSGTVDGSCALNCSHVWNYEQALSRLFPDLERSMRETDWDVLQAPEGYLAHRVRLPVTAPQLFGTAIGGPRWPAIDGMLGTVLKTYREVRAGAGLDWLERFVPRMTQLIDYVDQAWGGRGDGVLAGDQPVTYDISLHGPNMFVGGLWLAALRAMEEMFLTLGRAERASGYRDRFERSSAAYDRLLFNGEYYAQVPTDSSFDFGDGCLADQLLGQWWAHQLDLGHLLPADHIRSALDSIVRYNFRENFTGFTHPYRVFADRDDAGLLICTWPHGGRPVTPVRYADEVWTGTEYQVAAHCIYEGLTEQGLRVVRALRARYDGTRRNPFNEIECGDHYARAMAGWSLLDAYSGISYDASRKVLRLRGREGSFPFVTGTAWGQIKIEPQSATIQTFGGQLDIDEVELQDNRRRRAGHSIRPGETIHIDFAAHEQSV